jgi:hypothetical protein
MGTRQLPRKRLFLHIESLESRVVLSSLTIALGPGDQFGPQIPTVQAYDGAPRVSVGILDTGSSAITFSAADQAIFTAMGMPIPILAPGGAQAGGIGGYVQGDVSEPGTIYVDGMHSISTAYDSFGFPQYTMSFGASTPGIQAFVGNAAGSATLPTVTGTAIFNPSAINPQGLAALVALRGSQMGPDVHFVSPTYVMSSQSGTTSVRIPLSLFGSDNYSDPGPHVTVAPLPVDSSVSVSANGTTARNQDFLFDTGSQLTIISPALAASLHLNLSHPSTTIQIQGVGGMVTVPGFTVRSLSVPIAGGSLTFTSVPVYVLNVGSGFDGVLGMNLFNRGGSMLYNPYGRGGASLSVNFYTNAARLPAPGSVGINPAMLHPPGMSAPSPQPPVANPAGQRPRGFIILVSLDAGNLSASPGSQARLFVTLEQTLPPGKLPTTTNVVEDATRVRGSTITVMPGYGAVFVPDSTPETPATPAQPGAPAPQRTEPVPTPPADAPMPAPDAQAEAVTAFFASIPQTALGDDDVPVVGPDHSVATETVTKLAIVMAGLWGSIYKKESPRTRQPVMRTA